MAPLTKSELAAGRETVEKSMFTTSKGVKITMLVLLAIILNGVAAYIIQLVKGLAVTGLSHKIFWGLYISNFVFFIGVSHAGTLISAILRVTNAEWRTPITRLAEEITVLALIFGATSVLIDMGRIDRVWHIPAYPNITSPLIWDVTSITFYLIGSLIFLYIPLIPDFAYYRDNLGPEHKWRVRIYKILALNFKGEKRQFEILESNIGKMSYIIIGVAVSVHTVVSWIFSMTWRVGWKSTIFGPYFVIGAIFSGIASLLMAMVFFTWIYKLDTYLTKDHFISLAKLFLVFTIFYVYFTFAEYLTEGYGSEKHAVELLHQLYYGAYAGEFWYFVIGGLFVPMFLLLYVIGKKDISAKNVKILVLIAATLANVGMWIKRYIIIVPVLALPTLEEPWYTYSWFNYVEVSIFAAQVAGFVFLYILLSKLVPIISLWEVEHEAEEAEH